MFKNGDTSVTVAELSDAHPRQPVMTKRNRTQS
jgi:hypothetical protein